MIYKYPYILLVLYNNSFSLLDCQEFDFVSNNDEFMITLSNNNIINIYFWKSNFKSSIDFNKILESKDKSIFDNQFLYMEFKDKKAFGIYCERPWIINLTKYDWRTYIFNDINHKNIVENNKNQLFEENIFMDIEQKLHTKVQNKIEFIEEYFISPLKNYINNTENFEIQDEYNLELKEENRDIILEVSLISNPDSTPLYITKLSLDSSKHMKVNNMYIIYNDIELHIYTL